MTLNECKRELSSIIREIREVENGVRRDFDGIGENLCGNCIDKVADKYDGVLRKLNRVNLNRVAEWAAKGD